MAAPSHSFVTNLLFYPTIDPLSIAILHKRHTVSRHLYQKATFLLSVANSRQLPSDQGIEVAFIGRSNTGKSSVLNRVTHNKQLARVSKTPGRTQYINLFALDAERRLADLPGYGYAKVPPEMKKKWQALLETYLSTRNCLKGVILVMDIRHPLKAFDQLMLDWCSQYHRPIHILLNKSDKLSRSAIKQTKVQVERAIKIYANPISLQVFSALTTDGTKELQDLLNKWFCY